MYLREFSSNLRSSRIPVKNWRHELVVFKLVNYAISIKCGKFKKCRETPCGTICCVHSSSYGFAKTFSVRKIVVQIEYIDRIMYVKKRGECRVVCLPLYTRLQMVVWKMSTSTRSRRASRNCAMVSTSSMLTRYVQCDRVIRGNAPVHPMPAGGHHAKGGCRLVRGRDDDRTGQFGCRDGRHHDH